MSQNLKSKKFGLTFTVSEEPFSTEHRFNGNKLEFTKLMREIEQAVRSNSTTVEYIDYVVGGFKRKQNPSNPSLIEFEIPEEFSLLKIPATPNVGNSRFSEIMSVIKMNREHNKGVAAFKATLYKMICDRCSLSFSSVFREWGHEPFGIIDHLYSNYGSENLTQSESCANVYIFIMFKFDPSRRITEERMRYQQYVELLNISDELQLAMLRATKDEVPFQLLPDRLIPTLRFTIEQNYSLEETWTHLITVDTDQHTRGHLAGSIKRSGDCGVGYLGWYSVLTINDTN